MRLRRLLSLLSKRLSNHTLEAGFMDIVLSRPSDETMIVRPARLF